MRHIDWNVTARMDTPYVREYLEDRELTAWLLLDRSPSMGFGPADRPEGARPHRARHHARPPAHPRRQPRRRDPLRQRGRARRRRRAAAATRCCALTRDLLRARARRAARSTDLAGLLDTARQHDQAPLAGRARLRLHQRAGLGAAAAAAGPAPRGGRDPPLRPARGRAARRRADRRRGRRDRRAAVGRHQRPRVPPPARTSAGDEREADAARPRPRAPASTSYDVSTEDDLVGALVAHGRVTPAAEALMSFRVAVAARVCSSSSPLLVAAYVRRAAPARRRARRARGARASCATGVAARARAGSATCRSRSSRRARRCCSSRSPARDELGTPRREGTVDPRVRRVEQHAGRRPGAHPPGRGQGRGARVRRESSPTSIRIGVVAFSDGGLVTAAADRTRRPTCSPRSTASRRRAARRSAKGIFTALSAIAGKPIVIDEDALDERPRPASTSATSARPSIVLLSDGENTADPDPLAVAELASVAGVQRLHDRHRQPRGHGGRDRRVQRGHRARRGDCSPRSPRSPTARTSRPPTPTSLAEVYDSDRPEVHDRARADRGHRAVHRRRRAAARRSARRCRCSGSGGWCDDVVHLAARPAARCSPCRCCSASYLWQLRRRRKQAVRFSSVALIRAGCPKRSRWRRHVPVGAVARRPRRCSAWPRPAADRARRAARPHVDHPRPRRVAVDVRHRRRAEPARRGAGGGARVRRGPGRRHAHRHRRVRRLRRAGRCRPPPTREHAARAPSTASPPRAARRSARRC